MMMNELERFLKPSGVNINEFISEENVKIVFAKVIFEYFRRLDDDFKERLIKHIEFDLF